MSRAILANAYRILSLSAGSAPTAAWRRVTELRNGVRWREPMPTEAEALEAAMRLADHSSRLAETVFAGGPEGSPWTTAANTLNDLVTQGAPQESWLDTHRAWAAVVADPKTERGLRELSGNTRVAREFAKGLPAMLLATHSSLGATALSLKQNDQARMHARAILDSPHGTRRDKERALRGLFAQLCSEAAKKLTPLEETLKGFGGELPPEEARSVDWDSFLAAAEAAATPSLSQIESIEPAGADLTRDALAEIFRDVALLTSRIDCPLETVKARLEAARGHARSPRLRSELDRAVADPAWAALLGRALANLGDGKPDRAWKKLKALRQIAETDARRKWTDEIMDDPTRQVARQRWKPLRIAILGTGFGYFGRRVVDAEEGTYVASHGLLFLGLPIATRGAYMLREVPGRRRRREQLFIGRVPERFRPSQWKAALLMVATVLVVLTVSGLVLDFVHGSREHARISAAWQAVDAGNADEARELATSTYPDTPIGRWRLKKLRGRIVLDEIESASTPFGLLEVMFHANKLDPPRDEFLSFPRQPDPELPWQAAAQEASWFSPELDDAVLAKLRTFPVPVLVRGGGRPFTEESDAWNDEADEIADFLDWACRRSQGLFPRRHDMALEFARRFDTPHQWALLLKVDLADGRPPDPEALGNLERFLGSSRYMQWAEHFLILERAGSPFRSADLLREYLHDIWTGVDFTADVKILELCNRLPEDLVALRKVPEWDDPAMTLAMLEGIRIPKRAIGPEAEWYSQGWRRKYAQALLARGGARMDLKEAREGIEALKDLVRELPQDERSMELICMVLLNTGWNADAVTFAKDHTFRYQNAFLGKALYRCGRLSEAVEVLETNARERLPAFRRLVDKWADGVRAAQAYWTREYKGLLPPEGQRDYVMRQDHLPPSETPGEWYARLAEIHGKAMKWKLRCMLAAPDADGVRSLARAHAALAFQGGKEANSHLERAIALLDESRHWREPEPDGDEELLQVLREVRASPTMEVALERIAREGPGPVALVVAEVAERAGIQRAALSLYEAAWERLGSPKRTLAALGCARLERDQEKQIEWQIRGNPGGEFGERLREALEIKHLAEERRFDSLAPKARSAAAYLAGIGDSPVLRAGSASCWFVAWIAAGDKGDLDRAATIIRDPRTAVQDPRTAKALARILFARANLELSDGSLREEVLHEVATDAWIGYAVPETRKEEIAARARASGALNEALAAAARLTELDPTDLEGWEMQIACLRSCGDLDGLNRLRLLAERPKESRPSVFDPLAVLRGLSPGQMDAVAQSAFAKSLDASVTAAKTLGHPPTLARALARRAQFGEALRLEASDPEILDSILEDAEAARAAHDAPETRQVLMRLLLRRASFSLAKETPALTTTVFANHALMPGTYLASWARIHREEGAHWKDNPDVARACRLAEAQLEAPSSWLDVETVAALELGGSTRVAEAAKRFSIEGVEETTAVLRHSLYDRSEDFTVSAWLATQISGDTGDADRIAAGARAAGVLEGVIWK